MRKELFLTTLRLLASLLSGVLLILAYPDYDVAWLAWIALVPLILAILSTTPKQGFFLCFAFSVVLFSGVCRWIFEVSRYSILHHLLVNLILGVPLSGFGWAFAFLSSRRGVIFALSTAPFMWVSLEYVRSNLSFLSVPWGLLAHSQYQTLSVIQISSVTGAYGVSFLIVMVNAALAALLLGRLKSALPHQIHPRLPLPAPGRKKTPKGGVTTPQKEGRVAPPLSKGDAGGFQISKKGITSLVTIAALLSILTLIYGYFTITNSITGKKIKISLVQGNIEQTKKWDRRYRNYILERYEELSRQASKDQRGLVIWPEAATPGFVLSDFALKKRITELVREMNTYFLIGSCEYPKFQKTRSRVSGSGNTALFFSPEGNVLGQYLKIRLVPFAEYVPYQKLIPWPRFIVPEGKKVFEVPGNEITLFDLQAAKFGVLICWESIFPGLFRSFVKEGAHFMVNITNEGWFYKPTIFHQYVAMNVFRAVENRVYLVRCANTGISCFIDPYGKVIDRVKDNKGQDIHVPGVLTVSVIASDSKTIYTRWGDWFSFLNIACSIACLILTLTRRRRS
jgi:apolipoprotein N-acyltransferase